MRPSLSPPKLFLSAVLILTLAAFYWLLRSPLSRAIHDQRPIFALMIGTDYEDYARHSDTIILAHYSPGARSLDLLSIPRDTRMLHSEIRVRRINEIYAYYYKTRRNHDEASRGLADAVQNLVFSVDPSSAMLRGKDWGVPKIPYYVQIDYDGFKRMIDLLGGLEVTVDEPMNYDDNWGKLHIHFNPGKVMLNGQKALEYIRYRGHSGDSGRILRQQEFLENIFKRFKNPVNILRLPKLVWISAHAVHSNLGRMDRLLALWELKDLPMSKIRLMQLPGKPSREGLWIPDSEGIAATAGLLESTGTLNMAKPAPESQDHESQDHETQDHETVSSPLQSRTTVEVWNATSKKGLALEVARKLRNAGFDVVKWGDYNGRQIRTLVRDHRGDIRQAREIASILASSRLEVLTRMEMNPLVDVEVILGEDFGSEK